MKEQDSAALGVDIGGVIISRNGESADTSFSSENYLATPEVPGAIDSLRRLVDERFGERVFLVSKCGPRVQAKTMRWLKHHDFFERTGIKKKNVRFCLERSEKDDICRKLGVTHFIDDRLDVLVNLKTVPHRYLFEQESSGETRLSPQQSIVRVVSWQEVAEAILAGV